MIDLNLELSKKHCIYDEHNKLSSNDHTRLLE